MKFALIAGLTLASSGLWAQETLVKFVPTWGEHSVQLPLDECTKSVDNVHIEECKFYISNIEVASNDQIVWKEPKSFHLIDLSTLSSTIIALEIPEDHLFNTLSFILGIDSVTSTSGVFGGDLDPTNAMYWTWQSGYIFSKLEGTSPSSKARKNKFQFHLGGYKGPYAAQRDVQLQVDQTNEITIAVDLQVFFDTLDLEKTTQVMIPGKQAAHLSTVAASMFKVPPFESRE